MRAKHRRERKSPRAYRFVIVIAATLGAVLLFPGIAQAVPANDDFADRITVGTPPFTDTQDATTATTEGGEPSGQENQCMGLSVSNTVWYQFTPPSDTVIEADTYGSDFSTFVTVWTGSTLATLTEVACNEGVASDNAATLLFPATAGTTYIFQTGGTFGGGNLTFHLAKVDGKDIKLTAKPKVVDKGERTKLTAAVTPCAGQEGDTVEFWRGDKRIATKATNSACKASKKVKVQKTSTFTAIAPVQDNDDFGGASKKVKVRAV